MNVAFVLAILGTLIVILEIRLFLRYTIFDISFFKENSFALLWYYDLFQVLAPLVIISYLGIDNIPLFFIASSGIEFDVVLLVLVTLSFYLFSLGLFLRIFGFYGKSLKKSIQSTDLHYLKHICRFLIIWGIALLIMFYVLNYKHAYLTALIDQVSVLKVRLENKYFSQVPSQISSLLPLTGYLLALVAGKLYKFDAKYSIVSFLFAEFFLTTPGDKSLPFMGILLYFFSINRPLKVKLFSLKNIITIFVLGCIFLVLIYFVVSLQIPNLTVNSFLTYLFQRLGMGQMVGLYETYALIIGGYPVEGEFYWHAVPFAKLFVNYIDYQKFLMMVTEGYEYTEMGVKNSYFLAEAYAIGRVPLAVLSPIIVGFVSAVTIYVVAKFMRKVYGKEFQYLAIPICLLYNSLTGGFSSFMLFKGLILLMLQLGFISILFHVSKSFATIRIRRHSRIIRVSL